MLRNNKTSTSMQKTYDECYLICSTAVYFEGQNNEEEALRSWRSALDRIYYHNAYKVAPNYQPASATEKALLDSLREMELQCKERVSLLEALKKSREEAEKSDEKSKPDNVLVKGPRPLPKTPNDPATSQKGDFPGWIGGGSVPSVSYDDIPTPSQHTTKRPSVPKAASTESTSRSKPKAPSSSRQHSSSSQLAPKSASSDYRDSSRTPSPEKKTSMLRSTLRSDKNGKKPGKPKDTLRAKPPTAGVKAAGMAWDAISKQPHSRPDSGAGQHPAPNEGAPRRPSSDTVTRVSRTPRPLSPPAPPTIVEHHKTQAYLNGSSSGSGNPPARPPKPGYAAQQILQQYKANSSSSRSNPSPKQPPPSHPPVNYTKPPPDFLKYRSEYPAAEPVSQAAISAAVNPPKIARSDVDDEPEEAPIPVRTKKPPPPPPPVSRRPVARTSTGSQVKSPAPGASTSAAPRPPAHKKKSLPASTTQSSDDEFEDAADASVNSADWRERLAYIKKNLPKGVDEAAAKSIFNEIVVEGDEVHWDDVAGLDAAKTALKEAVVYPFLRPDLFMGLREPARGMLLFGPPGTGKTMLARAVATESRSTFFAISASSLTSKWMGESEKLVRALFQLAKALAPSIIFVDEIDSLLSSRGDGEHETTRRIKTEFLIQWSDLQRAAAGKEPAKGEGDASRVLVLAATNLPWAIDEAARRRFVRRQYIPLPEAHVREQQLKTLLSHQKQSLSKNDIKVLVEVTDGYSGSDITALAKDAAMGPLRSLGESLLHMSPDEIRPISFDDFEASLINIRPSVSKQGLKEFEDWAREFGERAG